MYEDVGQFLYVLLEHKIETLVININQIIIIWITRYVWIYSSISFLYS